MKKIIIAIVVIFFLVVIGIGIYQSPVVFKEIISMRCYSSYEDMNPDKAIDACKMVIAIDPDDSIYYQYLGFAYMKKNEIDLAKKTFQDCINVDPKTVECYHELARIYVKENKFDDAINMYEKTLLNNRKAWNINYEIAGVYIDHYENYEKAISYLIDEIKNYPSNNEAYFKLAECFKKTGNKDKADKLYSEVQRRQKEHDYKISPEIRELLGIKQD